MNIYDLAFAVVTCIFILYILGESIKFSAKDDTAIRE